MQSALLIPQKPKTNLLNLVHPNFYGAAPDVEGHATYDYASPPVGTPSSMPLPRQFVSIADLLDFIYVNDIPVVEALLNTAAASPKKHDATSAQAIRALRDSTVRRNMADWLVDDACASLLAPSDVEDRLWSDWESLLIKSLLLAPDFVNAYYWLGEWYRTHHVDTSPYKYLMHHWTRYGGGNESALQFILQYRDGDPYQCSTHLRERIGTATVLVLYMSDDLHYLDLLEYHGHRSHPLAFVGRIESPNLICAPRDFHRLPTAKQTIAEDLVKRGKDTRVVIHRGTCVQAGDRSVFGPAVDTLYYNHVLHKTIYRNPAVMGSINTVFEIGTGTGFLLCSIVRAFRGTGIRVLASDVNPQALEVARANIERTIAESHGSTGAHALQVSLRLDAQSLNTMADGSVDLLLSNPPYIPTYRQDYAANPYEGIHVLEDVLVGNGPRVLSSRGIIIMLYSSLSAHAVQHHLRESPLVAMSLAAPLRVPLDLREINNDPRWVRLLQRQHGLEVDFTSTHYVFWHTLHMIMLCHPQNRLFGDSVDPDVTQWMDPSDVLAPISIPTKAVAV